MISLIPTVARLKSGGYANVEAVMEFVGLSSVPRALPALFVVPQNELASPNRMTGIVDQRVMHALAIVLVLGVTSRRPGDVSDELTVQVRKIHKLMLGWLHPDASGPFEYAGGRLTSVDGQVITWSIGFNAPYHLRS